MLASTGSRPQKMNKVLLVCLLFLTACFHSTDNLSPKLDYSVQDKYLKRLPSPFSPLSPEERSQDWSKEYMIGLGFAHELDLYQAMTAFKRAEFLSPSSERKLELQYDVFLCYYLGKKYLDATYTFETTDLRSVTPSFPAHHDLLIILYDCYIQQSEQDKADCILTYIAQYYPETAQKLNLSGKLIQGDITTLENYSLFYPEQTDLKTLLSTYEEKKKSVATAQTLNFVLPGAGYFYVGQTQSAFTALALNGLFIWATVHFFQHGDIAAGFITAGFEAGWYFGGIYGAGHEARYYNDRVYEKLATPMMNEKRLFPILMLKYAF